MRLKTFGIIAAALCGLLIAGCEKKAEPQEAAVAVTALKLTGVHVKNGARFSGVIAAEKDIALTFLSAGEVKAVNVRDGERVRKGQLLAVIDSTDAQSLYNAARAKLDQALDAYKRYQPLHNSGNMSELDWKKVTTARQEAQAAFEIAGKTLDNCNLTAPDDGAISGRKVEAGDTAIAGVPVMRLLSLDKLYAELSVPLDDARHIKEGMSATVRLTGTADIQGRVETVDVAADTLTRTYKTRVLIENPGAGILPGMLCSVYILEDADGGASDELVIPAEALQLGADGGYFVYVVDPASSRARRAAITANGFEDGGVAVAPGGLAEGDVIVTAGAQKLDEGVLVDVQLSAD